MPAEWNAERVLALAPDEASAKAGRGLASPGKWANVGRGDGMVWGECQGSGKVPYRTKLDPDEPAFSCSCPSHKFPCKHVLGLMLVWAAGPGAVAESKPPEWVAAWKEARTKKIQAKQAKAEAPETPADLAAKAKREAARAAKVSAGVDDLSLWLADLARQGFAALGARPASLWADQARRLVDAQAPGLAGKLRQVDAMSLAGEGWQAALLDRLARIHLLCEASRRPDDLPPDVLDDVRAAIGYPADLDAVRAGPALSDRWQVIGQSFSSDENLNARRTWLLGRDSGRPALLLDFAAGTRPFDPGLPPGTVVDADLCFFPGAIPLRSLIRERRGSPENLEAISGDVTIADTFAAFGVALAKNPWLELVPVALADVVLAERDGAWSARDASGRSVPFTGDFQSGWHLLALGGGGPLTIAGEFDGATLRALSCIAGGRFVPLLTAGSPPPPNWPGSATANSPAMAGATASAVVGVGRQGPSPLPPDSPIGAALIGLEALDAPEQLLSIAAAAGLHGRVGRIARVDPTPEVDLCPPETQDECRPEAAARLRTLLGGDQPEVLLEWVQRLAGSSRRMPADTIVEALDRWTFWGHPAEPLLRGLGVRGRWLAGRNPGWRKLAAADVAADPDTLWETGSRPKRLSALLTVRAADPGRARDLLASTFARESADDRAGFLQVLGVGLTMTDEPFLEAALDDRAQQVRRRAADLLAALPGSRFGLRMIERARGLLAWEARPKGRKALVATPPTACDKAMIRDGVRPKAPAGSKGGDRATWLRDVIAVVPPSAIAGILGASACEIIEANRGGDWGRVLIEAWAEATVRQRDADWADALLEADPEPVNSASGSFTRADLFEILPTERRAAIVEGLIAAEPSRHLGLGHPAFPFIDALGRPIESGVARALLGAATRMVEAEREEFAAPGRRAAAQDYHGVIYDHRYHDDSADSVILTLGQILPPELAGEAGPGSNPEGEPPLFYAHAYAQMIDLLSFRRDMHRELAP